MPAPSLEEAQEDWDRTILPSLVATAYSPVIEVDDGKFEAITVRGRSVEVWDLSADGWGRSGQRLELEFPIAVFGEEAVLLPADDLTGDGVDDVVAELYGNDPVGAVLVRTAEEWANATFGGESYPKGLTLQGRDLVSFYNQCVPSCVEGQVIQRLWEWKDGLRGASSPATAHDDAATPAESRAGLCSWFPPGLHRPRRARQLRVPDRWR